MLSCLFVLAVTSLSLSNTESGKTSFPEDICNTNCTCRERQNFLNIYCEDKRFTTFRQFRAPPGKISQLFLMGNFLLQIRTNEFIHYGIVISLDLGNSSLQEIRPGAFYGLSFLKTLDLNYNNLEVIKSDMLVGLEGLEYLHLDDNYISTIEPGAFRKLVDLKVLTLMHNELSFLPPKIFRFMRFIIRLDLRGNRLKMLPLAGVLEDMSSIPMIELQGNPWNCTCPILALINWMLWLDGDIRNIYCNSPSQHAGRKVQGLSYEDICPKPSEVPPPQNIPPTKSLTSVSTTTPVYTPEPRPEEPFSALMLSLVAICVLSIFILSVCFITAIFKLVLKRCRGAEHVPTGTSNFTQLTLILTVQVQNGCDTPEHKL